MDTNSFAMNPYAYLSTGIVIKALSNLSRARIHLHGVEHVPRQPAIFVINHFTRIETLLMPTYLHSLTGMPIWSLADVELFTPTLSAFLDKVGAVSTGDPDRDRLIVKTLLTGEAAWIIYPEGRMVKNKKLIEKGRYMIAFAGGKHPPHTGAATLALRTEFYRRRMTYLSKSKPEEFQRLRECFDMADTLPRFDQAVVLVPVNLTYYPLRARENVLSRLAARFNADLPERFMEELMTEGSMLLSGVDVDIRFGPPIEVAPHLRHHRIQRDIHAADPFDFDDPIPCIPFMRKAALRLMKQYMDAIYGMTTVNHDHLFATLFRHSPGPRVRNESLRRRAFVAATAPLREMGVYAHTSLTENQTHLLTDDRFGKFADFHALATRQKEVQHNEEFLEKRLDTFGGPFDFNRVRIDNPLAVIANEVEPLGRLTRYLGRLAWVPDFWIRRRIARMLIEAELDAFEADYEKYFIDGESKEKSVGRPYLLKGRTRDLGVLLVHGYMAAPLEVRELADYLHQRGIWVYAPRLKGHGTAPEDLAERQYADWEASVDTGYAILSQFCRRVVVGGFSNGAGLALGLASRIPKIVGVFAISPPLRLQDFSARFVPAMDAWNRLMKKIRLEGARMTFVDNHPENPEINYRRNPIAGVRELERLMERVAGRLDRIEMPALIMQAQGDPVVDAAGSRKVFDRLGTADKVYVLFNFHRHGIVRGEGADQVHRAVWDFVRRFRKSD